MNLVTGATGLLGAHVMLHLLQNGEEVVALHRQDSSRAVVQDILESYSPGMSLYERITWREGDILDITSLNEGMAGCTHVYHCAAIVSYHRRDRQRMYKVNVEGTANVVNVCLAHGVRRLCHVSSIAAIGKSGGDQYVDEQTEWKDSAHNTHYGITKRLAESEVWRGIQEGLPAVIANPGFIIGPGDFSRSSPGIFPRIEQGIPFSPPGGTGFIDVRDVAELLHHLMLRGISGERYILVSENRTMRDVFHEVALSLGKTPPHRVASSWMLHTVRILDWLKQLFTGKKALITRESLRNASVHVRYNNQKIRELTSIEFRSVHEAILQTARFYAMRKSG